MGDLIMQAFLQQQNEAGAALAANSDVLNIVPLSGEPASSFILEYHCQGLVRGIDGVISMADAFAVGLNFPSDYLRRVAHAAQILMWLQPKSAFHPNISPNGPFICIGDIKPGTGIVDIAFRVFDLITWNNFCPVEDDALNMDACAWARHNMEMFPVDDRSLKCRPGLLESQ